MERLIMEFTVGDGYTYSADVTYPVVYSSKEEALHDFEILLIQKIDSLSHLYKDRNSLYEENNKITRELAKISSDKRMSQKDKDKNNQTLYQSFTDLRNEKITPLEEKIKEVEIVSFGGQTFNLHDFVYKRESDNQMDYCMPNISTLNEYFSSIEQNLSNTKKLKF